MKVGEVTKEAEGSNLFAALIDEADGLEKIEALQNHTNNDIYEKAMRILEQYFGLEDEEDQNLAPGMDASGSQFTFGPPAGGGAALQGGFNF